MAQNYIDLTSRIKIRFEASDLLEGSVVEAGIDAVTITTFECGEIPPEPDLECQGSLSWNDVSPGEIVSGSFDIVNIGESESELDWVIAQWPEWGTWNFTPANGEDLTPENGPFSVQVEVVAPEEENTEFEGEITIVNDDDAEDFCVISVYLKTPYESPIWTLLDLIMQRFPLFDQFLQFFLR
jgi:hypothetical protein